MGSLHLSNHAVQNRQTGEHWAMLNKENLNVWICLTCPIASLALHFGHFVARDR